MDEKPAAKPNQAGAPTEAEIEAERIRLARQAKREKKIAAAEVKALAKKTGKGRQDGGPKNPFSFPGSGSKGATSIPRAIISRARGGRSR